tara:strand:- start:2562 stop:3686 length:1125 start_codon:yes stop_codon:yes gene_type:complete
MTEFFPLPLLQAVSNWQIASTRKRGVALKKACAQLPEDFRTSELMCFRQIALEKKYVWHLVGDDSLLEKISSWTCDSGIAKQFKYGVPLEGSGYQGVILCLFPPAGSVIVNLQKLYRDPEFNRAMEQHSNQIKNYEKGAGRYQDTQCEVVLEIGAVRQEDIYSLGGHSSPMEKLLKVAAEEVYGRSATPAEEEDLLIQAERHNIKAGPKWLTREATERVLFRIKPKALRLAELKQLQSLAADIKQKAQEVRDALEFLQAERNLPPPLSDFPTGSSLYVANVLGQYLIDTLDLECRTVTTLNPDDGSLVHAWVWVQGLAIDITGDQFPYRPEVYSGPQDMWFAALGEINEAEGGIAGEDREQIELLQSVKQKLLK